MQIVGYTISRRRQVLHHHPSSKDLGKPLGVLAILLENGVRWIRHRTAIHWKPEIFGGYVELRMDGFLDHPISLRKASEIGRERGVWTFYRDKKRYKAVSLTNDYSMVDKYCDRSLVDRVCEIEGLDLLLLSSVQTPSRTYRCVGFDTTVSQDRLGKALDSVTRDASESCLNFKKAAQAAYQACYKIKLREKFLACYSDLQKKYGNIVLPKTAENNEHLATSQSTTAENQLFVDLTRGLFANEFGIGLEDGTTTSKRIEELITFPKLSLDPVQTFEIYDAILERDIDRLTAAKMNLGDPNFGLEALLKKTAENAIALIRQHPSLGTMQNRRGTAVMSGLAPKSAGEELVVDGANFSFYHNRPCIRRLECITNDLRRKGFRLKILMDSSVVLALRNSCTSEEAAFLYRNVIVVPLGRKADEYILDYANANGLRVVSGDSFREYAYIFPWVFTKRVIKPVVSTGERKVISYGIYA